MISITFCLFNFYPLHTTMTRQNQYKNLMLLFKELWTLDTDKAQREYIARHWHPIQIGTRIWYLVRSWYLVKFDEKYKLKQYALSMKGQDWKELDHIYIVKSKKEDKVRVSREESEVIKECKEINFPTTVKEWDVINVEMKNWKITKTQIKQKQPPIQPTTLWGKIQFYFMRLFK